MLVCGKNTVVTVSGCTDKLILHFILYFFASIGQYGTVLCRAAEPELPTAMGYWTWHSKKGGLHHCTSVHPPGFFLLSRRHRHKNRSSVSFSKCLLAQPATRERNN